MRLTGAHMKLPTEQGVGGSKVPDYCHPQEGNGSVVDLVELF